VNFASSKFCERGNGRASFRRTASILGGIANAIIAGGGAPTVVEAASGAEAAQRPPLSVPIFVNSRNDECYDSGALTAIKRLATEAQDRINRDGGVAGRLSFLDNQRDQQKTIANLASAVSDPQTVAMIGLSNATLAKAAFDAAGKDLKATGIPLISDISVGAIIADYPNVFTTRPSEDEERMPVIAQFVKQMKIERPAFVGLQSVLGSNNLGDALKKFLGEPGLVADNRLPLTDDKLDPTQVAAMVADLKAKNADLVFLSIGGNRTKGVLKQFMDAGFTPPLFVSGRIESATDSANAYPNDIYQLAFNGLPEVYNDRLRKLVANSADPNDWIFEGGKNPDAPGWKSGECKPRDDDIPLNALDAANMRALATGTQYADIVALIAAAARSADPTIELPDLRALIVRQLGTAYASGRGTFKGTFNNWSFQPSSRAAARTPLIVMLPNGLGRTQLAPVQFVHLRS